MTDEKMLTADQIKTKQYIYVSLFIGILIVGLIILYFVMDSDGTGVKKENKKMESVPFASATDHINAQSVWMERAQNQLRDEQRKTTEMKQQIDQLKSADSQKTIESDPRYQALHSQVEALQKAFESTSPNTPSQLAGSKGYSGQVFPTMPGTVSATNQVNGAQLGIDNDELNLKSSISLIPKKNKDTYVPAGAFAGAIMLEGADASAGVSSQSNPSPIVFRITDNGTLPNRQHSHLNNCFVTVAVVGDISSERGDMRTERISCTFPNGEIVEQVVEGTVSGMDGKNGVRGTPLWREGALLGRAAVAGSLSGFAHGISETYTTNSISPLGSTQTVNNGDIMKVGFASGASNAMEKLADYNIRRAEQYHPVIQITAGQPVNIVFLKGFYLDGKKHDEVEQSSSSQPELFEHDKNETATGLTLSEHQLEKIKQHENALGVYNNNSSDSGAAQ